MTTQARPVAVGGRPPGRHLGRPWLFTAIAATVAVLVNLPLLNALLVSFKTDADITRSPLSLPIPPSFDHFANAIYAAGYDFPRFFLNSTLIALGSVTMVCILALPATYAIVRLGLGGPRILNGMSSLRLLPAIFFAVPLYLTFSGIGLLDTIPALVLTNTFLNLPLAMILIAAGLSGIPIEMEEAATVDGASTFRVLGQIVLPIMAPTLVAVAVLTFLFSWDDYLFGVILTTTRATPVTVGAANFVTSYGIRWGDISAATVLSALPPIVFAVVAQRYLVSGLSMGAVKG